MVFCVVINLTMGGNRTFATSLLDFLLPLIPGKSISNTECPLNTGLTVVIIYLNGA